MVAVVRLEGGIVRLEGGIVRLEGGIVRLEGGITTQHVQIVHHVFNNFLLFSSYKS